jgi:hypothetical protein
MVLFWKKPLQNSIYFRIHRHFKKLKCNLPRDTEKGPTTSGLKEKAWQSQAFTYSQTWSGHFLWGVRGWVFNALLPEYFLKSVLLFISTYKVCACFQGPQKMARPRSAKRRRAGRAKPSSPAEHGRAIFCGVCGWV